MLRPRIIPSLLIQNGGLIKTRKFGEPKYVGDPLNAVRIFNEKEVDELAVFDIDATRLGNEPNYGLIANLAAECRMPLCYGGGVTSAAQIEEIISLGVEKVAVGAVAVENPQIIQQAAERVGSQSIVVVVDYKKTGLLKRPEVVTRNATVLTGLDPIDLAQRAECLGAGEVIFQSVDRDGTMEGFDLAQIAALRNLVRIPVTALGGAGSLEHVQQLISAHPIIGAAAGSLFVFKGKYRAVLINYPTRAEKELLLSGLK